MTIDQPPPSSSSTQYVHMSGHHMPGQGGHMQPTHSQNHNQIDRIVHVVQVPPSPSIFTPWNIFVLVSIGLFLAYLYYSYTVSMTPKFEEKESPFVTDVTSPEVAATVLSGDGTPKVVLMHATWCEHCRIMMPAYNAAAEATRQVRWLKVEQASAKPILSSRSDIRGFPTIFGVKPNGEIVQYGEREPRTEDALKKWALQLVDPGAVPPPPFPSFTPFPPATMQPAAHVVGQAVQQSPPLEQAIVVQPSLIEEETKQTQTQAQTTPPSILTNKTETQTMTEEKVVDAKGSEAV